MNTNKNNRMFYVHLPISNFIFCFLLLGGSLAMPSISLAQGAAGTSCNSAHECYTVCHDPSGHHVLFLTLPLPSMSAHLGHGDQLVTPGAEMTKENCVNANTVLSTPIPNDSLAFSCTIESFLFKSGGRYDPAYASTINLKTGAVSDLNNGQSIHDHDVNAIGYNTTDNYIWGYDRGREKVARVDKNFDVELFTIPNLPQHAYHIADVSSSGVFFLADQWKDKGAIYKVDINPSSANYMQYIGKIPLKRPDGSFYSSFFTGIADFAFNPIDGQMYTIKSNGTVFKINPDTGVVRAILNVGQLGKNAVAIFFDKDGYFYYSAHNKIYRIDMNNPVAPNNSFANLAIDAEGDAARCPNAGLETPPPTPPEEFVPNQCGTPGFIETFGAGVGRAPIPTSAWSNYDYDEGEADTNEGAVVMDDQYTVLDKSSIPSAGAWWIVDDDHTGDSNGRMLMVNADYFAGEFYRQSITGLTIGKEYSFAAYIANAEGDQEIRIPVNVKFRIENQGNTLASVETGDILQDPGRDELNWTKYELIFTATSTNIDIVLSNNYGGGMGNDLVIDDISLSEVCSNVCRVDDLADSLYSTSSVSANSTTLSDSTRVYQAKFDNANWEGHILAYNLETADNNGSVKALQWDAADTISRTSRHLFTYNPTLASNRGKTLAWNQLNNQQQSVLKNGQTNSFGQKRLAWVQGNSNDEGSLLRSRNSILGDIINSNLIFKDNLANYGYSRLPEGGGYATFLGSKLNATPTLFIGANDGMLHAFNGSNGHELFAYVPNEIFPKLVTISDPNYGCKDAGCMSHEYLVDGKSSLGDAYFASSSDWHTVLIGGLGKGGKGIFALDVTNAESFTASDVLWEISSTQATSAGSDASEFSAHLGENIPPASIVRMNNSSANKRWAAVVGNGYNSASYQAVLFIIDLETGALIKKINTGSGTEENPNGLSAPIAVDTNNDSIADRIYAGDLLGNLWVFDVSGNNPASWDVDFSGTPLFTANQSITAAPQVGRHPDEGLMVYFGTGKYLGLSDNFYEGDAVANTYYGIHDNGSAVASSSLIEQTILQQSAADGTDFNVRITTKHEVDYTSHHGWYMDLPDAGERVISQALLRQGRLIFTTMTPPGNICEWGGTSWLMEFDAVEGRRLDNIPLDINDDKEFTEADNVTYDNQPTIISGVQDTDLGVVFSTPAVINHDSQTEGKYLTGTGGSIGMFRESASAFTGRMSWRQIR